jgi:hypothetical protein
MNEQPGKRPMMFWYSVLADDRDGGKRVMATFTEESNAQVWIAALSKQLGPGKPLTIVRHRLLDSEEVPVRSDPESKDAALVEGDPRTRS